MEVLNLLGLSAPGNRLLGPSLQPQACDRSRLAPWNRNFKKEAKQHWASEQPGGIFHSSPDFPLIISTATAHRLSDLHLTLGPGYGNQAWRKKV